MNLAQMLREEIRAYIEGRNNLAALRSWLADHVQDIADSGDQEVDRMDGRAWILISEMDYGHRDEADVRTEMERLLDAPCILRVVWSQERGAIEPEPDVVIKSGAEPLTLLSADESF